MAFVIPGDTRSKLQMVLGNTEDALAREDLGASLSFAEARPVFGRILRLCTWLSQAPLDMLPSKLSQQLNANLDSVIQRLHDVIGFTVADVQVNPVQARRDLLINIRHAYDALFTTTTPLMAAAAALSDPAQASLARLRTLAETAESDATQTLKKMHDLDDKASSILAAMQKASGLSAVVPFAEYFRQEADQHRRVAGWWLASTVALAVVAVGFGVYFLYSLSHALMGLPAAIPSENTASGFALSAGQSVQLAIAKIAIVAVLYMAVIWTGRGYKAHRHNYVVNKHRQNALLTFEAFVQSARDTATRDAVLLHAARCVFSPQATGYLHAEGESAEQPQVLEVIRSIVGRPAAQ
jgi:hypothetical protein